jgi:hypothetical protein
LLTRRKTALSAYKTADSLWDGLIGSGHD